MTSEQSSRVWAWLSRDALGLLHANGGTSVSFPSPAVGSESRSPRHPVGCPWPVGEHHERADNLRRYAGTSRGRGPGALRGDPLIAVDTVHQLREGTYEVDALKEHPTSQQHRRRPCHGV